MSSIPLVGTHPSFVFALLISAIKPGLKGEWERYPFGVIWSLGITSGIDIMIDGHVPLGAGLSSSAALECSVATALNHLFSLGNSLEDLARLTQRAENEYVGVPGSDPTDLLNVLGAIGGVEVVSITPVE